jgi:hypothetical protein
MYFHINYLNLGNFKEEILSIFQNTDPIYEYDFQINCLYHLHLFQPNGCIIIKLPLVILSIEDNEDIVEDIFLDLFPYMNKYLKSLEEQEFPEFPSYIGIYVSALPEEKIAPKKLALIKDEYLNDCLRVYKNFYIKNVLKIN